mmetsp:Transcript_35184/g.59728  ORF Transcript_35184/g.59728 Transcript_35184/m.59728 type:complete len:389 (-) Transcript_35184:223-1389(-)|eukprot:CAMPEP_0183702280 /NCGR_PEP_ID=MMETSP0737-20130205/433_1 /TAXON_ID=385413 /ORGANISM="Thalassiosira miniscula, Strain CCMP1093" /LENGTH=388 /DNA_ID=CAMNT_0025928861 /DNA_START=127 /DNA_END=1293 /DNA_ORIENTATION=+
MAFTDAQWQSLAIVPHFTAALSMAGDAWILFDILWRRKKTNKLPLTSYHRIIMFMSIWDFIVISFGKFPASWAMPADTPNVYYASGNRQTCTMQGFFIQFSLIVPMYNAITALYYLLVVHYGLTNGDIRHKYEKWMHIFPFAIASSFAIVGLVPSMLLYSTSTMWCWINAEPKGCIQSYEGEGPTTCTRGDNAYIYRLALYYCPIWVCIIFATISMGVIYMGVKATYSRSRIFQRTGSGRPANRRDDQLKQIAKQSFFYIGGFLLVWTFPTLNRVLAFFDIKIYALTLLHSIFSPLQGFVNFIVYMRPRLMQHIEQQQQSKKTSTLRASMTFLTFQTEKKEQGVFKGNDASNENAKADKFVEDTLEDQNSNSEEGDAEDQRLTEDYGA